MNDKFVEIRTKAANLSSSSSPEEVQALINTAESLLGDLLRNRGLTVDEFRGLTKDIIKSETEFIDSEVAKLTPPSTDGIAVTGAD